VQSAEPTDAGRRIVGQERATWAKDYVRRYKAGDSIRKIASDTGRSYGFVHRLLTESGMTLRKRGGARRRRSHSQARTITHPSAGQTVQAKSIARKATV
jgi:Helix-turn-helix domain